MYLAMLNEEQKSLFLQLAYQLALVDNDYSEKERMMIESYCNEMRIAVPVAIRADTVTEIIEKIKSKCKEVEKKIIIFEVMGLALADGHFDETERTVLKEIIGAFEVDNSFTEKSEKLLRDYIEMQNKMNILVLG